MTFSAATPTVLFADVVGFTVMSQGISPEALVELLDDLFRRLDVIAICQGLEKIKTIGDCYMAAAGLEVGWVRFVDSLPRPPPLRCARFLIDFFWVEAVVPGVEGGRVVGKCCTLIPFAATCVH